MLVKFGNWLFHYRNILFPVFYTALFIPSPGIFLNEYWAIETGSVFIVTGIMIRCMTIGLVYIIRGGNKRQIYAETLVTDGIYKVCRNPMYLGNIILILGFALFANSLLFLLICLPIFILFYFAIISAEEDFLSKKFGQQFIDYKAQTNSLIPQLQQLKHALKGQTFKWDKVINKEHNSHFLYFSGILILLLYKGHIDLSLTLYIESILLLFYAFIKHLKRKKLI